MGGSHTDAKLFLKHATTKVCVYRACKVALVVGTVLAFINHYEAILTGNSNSTNLTRILVTYLVPYSVSTFSSAMQAVHMEKRRSQL